MNTNVRIYFNLHKKCYSVQSRIDGAWRVTDYADELILDNVTFDVSAAGRERVRATKKKAVHAFLLAETASTPLLGEGVVHDAQATYNPYRDDTFVTVGEHMPLDWAYAAHLTIVKDRPIIWLEGPALLDQRLSA